ncbi:hypothetical protein OIV83_001567 [Microbotryomycetes sp. JL201]|nr:hypothetical protein OIV83_001567 [Microbotryomycetes sp. JL201]
MTSNETTYHEPAPPQLLTLLAFLYLLQVARNAADWAIGAGLVGECTVGVVFGPLTGILQSDWQETFIAIGYIGLVLIVFEGGLTMSPRQFLPSLPAATLAAVIGILAPVALTFALFSAFDYPLLWSFTVGSALASTSLGTTFFVLKTQGSKLGENVDLAQTRVGAVLQGAALIDDVVALVLLSVIVSLGESSDGSSSASLGWTIGRPIVASVALAIGVPVITWFFVRPCWRSRHVQQSTFITKKNFLLLTGTVVLSALLSAAYYAGTTMLLGAFLAGTTLLMLSDDGNFAETYDELVFVPLFFGSIGLSIPFLDLFTGRLVWRGIVFALLMSLGKVLVGTAVLLVDAACSLIRANRSSAASSLERDASEDQNNAAGAHESALAASFLGFAMVARGEIGILVLQVAHNSLGKARILGDEAYLVGLWAVVLCTIIGPVVFAIIVKKYGLRISHSIGWGYGDWQRGKDFSL